MECSGTHEAAHALREGFEERKRFACGEPSRIWAFELGGWLITWGA